MGYKVLGYVVWRGGKRYLRRRYPRAGRKLAIGGVAVLLIVVAGGVAAQRKGTG